MMHRSSESLRSELHPGAKSNSLDGSYALCPLSLLDAFRRNEMRERTAFHVTFPPGTQ